MPVAVYQIQEPYTLLITYPGDRARGTDIWLQNDLARFKDRGQKFTLTIESYDNEFKFTCLRLNLKPNPNCNESSISLGY